MDHDLNMMLRTPVAHSPNNSASGQEHEVTRVKVTSSGASTPTLANRGDPVRMSLASKRSEIEGEFWEASKPDTEVSVTVTGGGQPGDGSRAGSGGTGGGTERTAPGGPVEGSTSTNSQAGSGNNVIDSAVANGEAVKEMVSNSEAVDKDSIEATSNKSEADNSSNEIRTNLLSSEASAS